MDIYIFFCLKILQISTTMNIIKVYGSTGYILRNVEAGS